MRCVHYILIECRFIIEANDLSVIGANASPPRRWLYFTSHFFCLFLLAFRRVSKSNRSSFDIVQRFSRWATNYSFIITLLIRFDVLHHLNSIPQSFRLPIKFFSSIRACVTYAPSHIIIILSGLTHDILSSPNDRIHDVSYISEPHFFFFCRPRTFQSHGRWNVSHILHALSHSVRMSTSWSQLIARARARSVGRSVGRFAMQTCPA